MTPDQSLQGKRIVITGAGRGLGRALAIVAADQGADIVLLGRDATKLNDVADTIRTRTERDAVVVSCDLADPNSVSAACASVLGDNPVVDVLVNNGAPWLVGTLDELSDEAIASTVGASVTGSILMTKGLLPGLDRSSAADIITVISTCGLLGWDIDGASVPFYAGKHGQSGFSDRLRHELKDRGIRVSAIYPPDFDDSDPASLNWGEDAVDGAALSNREIVSTVLFMITAPRTCSFPVVVIDGMK